jgi:predicted dehydrogenase
MASDEDEIRDVRAAEERRSKRPIDVAAQRRRLAVLKKFREALQSGDIEKFKEAIIRDLGQQIGTPEYEQSLKIWDDFHGSSS